MRPFAAFAVSMAASLSALTLSTPATGDGSAPAGIVRLETRDRQGRLSESATGFAVGDGQTVLTAAHAVEGAASVRLAAPGQPPHPAAVRYRRADRDAAVLTTPAALPALPLARRPPRPGEPVTIWSNVWGSGLLPTDGTVRGFGPGTGDATWLVLDVFGDHGTSGAPVLATDGTVLGMVSHRRGAGGPLYAAPATALVELVFGADDDATQRRRRWLGWSSGAVAAAILVLVLLL